MKIKILLSVILFTFLPLGTQAQKTPDFTDEQFVEKLVEEINSKTAAMITVGGPTVANSYCGAVAWKKTLEQMAAFGINGGDIQKMFSSHPPLDERIAALRNAR